MKDTKNKSMLSVPVRITIIPPPYILVYGRISPVRNGISFGQSGVFPPTDK
jgi:hypothetical protein